MSIITFAFELTDSRALALAQFVKRVGWTEMRSCAVDDKEADETRAALDQVRTSLAEAGLAPR